MKAFLLGILVLLCLGVGLRAEVGVGGKWKNSLKPKGEGAETLTLASNGRTDYVILLSGSPSTQEQKAADDLGGWLKSMTGVEFSVVKESAGVRPSGKVISIGRTVFSAVNQIDSSRLGNEGYAIGVKGKNLFLMGGKTRGPINAVYALLEEDLDCRWYARGTSTIPHVKTLKFRPVSRRFVPVLGIRDPFYWDAFESTWALRNRTNARENADIPEEYGGNLNFAGFSHHTFALLVPSSIYFKDHPEYFSENNGKRNPHQLCITNPDVLRITIARVKELLKENPHAELIAVSPNYGPPSGCECPDCQKITDAEGSKSGPLLMFVNSVADAIAKDFPDVKVATTAYEQTLMPRKTIKPRPNVVIDLCTDSHAWPEPFLAIPETKKFQAAMKGWAAIGAKIHIWDYTVNFASFLAPMPNMQIVTEDIRFFLKYNAKGISLQGGYLCAGTADGIMKSWVWAKQLWDPSLDTRSLIRDFTYGYFGAAGEPMMEYQDMLWNIWEKEHRGLLKTPAGGCRYAMDLPVYTKHFLMKSEALFERAKGLAKDDETMQRVELAELPVMYVDLSQNYRTLTKTGKLEQPERFRNMLDRFEKVTRRERVIEQGEGVPQIWEWIALLRRVSGANPDEMRQFSASVGNASANAIRMPGRWKFCNDKDNVGVNNQWFASAFDDSAWKGCRTDMDTGWDTQGFDNTTPMYGWYRAKLTLPESVNGKHLYMFFGAVDEDAYVYVNGTLVMDHSCKSMGMTPDKIWNAPFMLDATSAFKRGQENVIAVRVYNGSRMGGIWRPVYVVSADAEMDLSKLQAVVAQGQ